MGDIEVLVDEEAFRATPPAQQRKLRDLSKRLRREPFLGDRVRRDRIQKTFRELPNLFRLELPGGWRAQYAVASHPTAGSQVRIVWIGDHQRYDRLFGY